jgi:CheY-like chemotaxis protein
MVRVLTKGGFRVLDAGSGADALRLLEKHGAGIDLLVTDLWLPGMDGRRLAAEVRGRQPAVPVLFVTGDPSQVINDPFLAKPFLPGHLLSVVHQALSAQADQRRAYRSDP